MTAVGVAVSPVFVRNRTSSLPQPDSLPGLHLWLQPSGITSSGAAVTGWTDDSGSGTDMEQATGANQPALIVSEPDLNGSACVHIDTAAKFLQEVGTGGVGSLTSFTIYVAGVAPIGSFGQSSLEFMDATGTILQHSLLKNNGADLNKGVYDGSGHRDTLSAIGAQHSATIFDAGALTVQHRKNGHNLGAALTYDGAANVSNKCQVSANGGASSSGGKIAEIIVYTAAHPATETAVVEAYLADKYNLPVHSALVESLLALGSMRLLELSSRGVVTTTGPVVTDWNDQSGVGHDLAEATAAERPAYEPANADLGGKPSILFDGTDDRLVTNDAAADWNFLHDGTGCTVVLVMRPLSNGGFFFDTGRGTPSSNGISIYRQGGGSNFFGFSVYNGSGTSALDAMTSKALDNSTTYVVSARYSSGSYSLRVDGSSVKSGGSTSPSASAASFLFTLGNLAQFGGLAFHGHVPAALTYNEYLSDSDVGTAELLLATEYGLTL